MQHLSSRAQNGEGDDAPTNRRNSTGWHILDDCPFEHLSEKAGQDRHSRKHANSGPAKHLRRTSLLSPERPFARRGIADAQAQAFNDVIESLGKLTQYPNNDNFALSDLLFLNWEIEKDLQRSLRPYGLTVLQWLTLRIIAAGSDVTIAHICHELGRPHGQVSPVCHTLAGAEWVAEDSSGPVLKFRVIGPVEELLPLPLGFSVDLQQRLKRWQQKGDQ